MYEHVFIAEKKSLADEVAKARGHQTGATPRSERSMWVVGNDVVVWLSGHMFELANPDYYDKSLERWELGSLPIIPPKWSLIEIQDKRGRIREVREVLKNSRKIVNVGDAGREGQLLVDELVIESGRDPFDANALRLWVKSYALKDMLDALNSMVPNVEKRGLYNTAICRQRADWLLGINMTRLYTLLTRQSGANITGPMSVGRVQSPTLRLVVDRDREIAKFRPVDHFIPTGIFKHENGEFRASWIIPSDYDGLDPEGRLIDKTVADRIAAKIAGKTGKIESFASAPKSKSPPLPFALSNLQKECSAKFGFSATKTLEVAQSLYEKKATTYPRSDSQYLPTAIFKGEASAILDNLKGIREVSASAAKANPTLKSPAWNDSKVTDHHAIIPTIEATSAKIASLTDEERKVFHIIAKTFIAQFHPDYRWDSMTAVVAVEGERFKATGKRVTQEGWKTVFANPGAPGDEKEEKDKDEDEDDQSLPTMSRNDPVLVKSSKNESKRTTPPSHFTEGTLIEAMKNIHRFVLKEDIKRRLKENAGLGQEATRAPIIETLKGRKFLVPKGKFIVSTPLGQSLIDALHQNLKDPGLTALWEELLERVLRNDVTVEQFVASLSNEVTSLVNVISKSEIKIAGAKPLPGHGTDCPSCGKGKLVTRTASKGDNKGKQFLVCDQYRPNDDASCRYSKWPDEQRVIRKLEGDGDTCPNCSKGKLATRQVMQGPHKGKRFLACDSFKKDDPNSCRYTAWEKPNVLKLDGDGDVCPECKTGHLITRVVQSGDSKGKRFLACDGFRKDDPKSCKYTAWEKPKIDKLEGDGDLCPTCGKGHLLTRVVHSGDSKGKRFLACDGFRKDDPRSCKYTAWEAAKAFGDGKLCPTCFKGHLRTREARSGENKGKLFLSCDAYNKDDPNSCRHTEWPEEKRELLPGEGTQCPKCGKGRLLTRKSRSGENIGKLFLSCDAYDRTNPASCNYSEWPKDSKGSFSRDKSSGSGAAKTPVGNVRARQARR